MSNLTSDHHLPVEIVRVLARKMHENWTADPLWVWSDSGMVESPNDVWMYRELQLISGSTSIVEIQFTHLINVNRNGWNWRSVSVLLFPEGNESRFDRFHVYLWNQPRRCSTVVTHGMCAYFKKYQRFSWDEGIQHTVCAQVIDRLIAEEIIIA